MSLKTYKEGDSPKASYDPHILMIPAQPGTPYLEGEQLNLRKEHLNLRQEGVPKPKERAPQPSENLNLR